MPLFGGGRKKDDGNNGGGKKDCPPHNYITKRTVKDPQTGKTYYFMECIKCGDDKMEIS